MDLKGIHNHFGLFGYKVCLEYLPEHEDQPSDIRDHVLMIGEGLGEDWIKKATLDDVCIELEMLGAGQAIALRSVALARLAEDIEYQFTSGRNLASWIDHGNHKLGVWAACACAREALRYVPYSEQRPLVAIETAESWVRGEATEKHAKEASIAALAAEQEAFARTGEPGYYAWQFYYAARSAVSAALAVYDRNGISNAAADAAEAYARDVYDAVDLDEYLSKRKDGDMDLVSVIVRSLQSFPVVLSTR